RGSPWGRVVGPAEWAQSDLPCLPRQELHDEAVVAGRPASAGLLCPLAARGLCQPIPANTTTRTWCSSFREDLEAHTALGRGRQLKGAGPILGLFRCAHVLSLFDGRELP